MVKDKKILLVEDNPDDIELTLRAFKKNNILNEIIVKTDGMAALDFFFGKNGITGNHKAELPILILLDLKIPKIGGIDVLKRLRTDERTKLIPVVILTSSKEPTDLISCYQLGCNSYLRKPVDFTLFTEMVRELGFYWLMMNEVPQQYTY